MFWWDQYLQNENVRILFGYVIAHKDFLVNLFKTKKIKKL
jgi:hypothetical protein